MRFAVTKRILAAMEGNDTSLSNAAKAHYSLQLEPLVILSPFDDPSYPPLRADVFPRALTALKPILRYSTKEIVLIYHE